MSTHINADGDGCGSQAALARLLAQMDVRAVIVNPTPWPEMFRFLLEDEQAVPTLPMRDAPAPAGHSRVEDASARGAAALRRADALVVLDISDVRRLGQLADAVRALRIPTLVIDHHIAGEEPPGDEIFSDVTACATGELIFDLAVVLGLDITPEIANSLYVALLTDTGGFRFSNTSPRCHAIAGQLLAAGVDPEAMYQRIYASMPVGRLHLLRDALATLEVDAAYGLAWISVAAGAMEEHGVRSEDLEGIAEHARSIAGTRMAIFFRDLGHGKVKISFRSTRGVDVNDFARAFGGGGHAKAAGALVAGTLDDVRARVIEAARVFLG